MSLGDIFENIKEAITGGGNENNQQNVDPNADQSNGNDQGILPASEDPMGDPADQGQYAGQQDGGILPASEDPMGDPADQR